MFESIDTKKNYEKVIEQIQELIMDGTFKSGDKLPPERELTKMLGISRTSLREALKALEVLGLIESKQGGGSYVANNLSSSILKSVAIAFKLNNGTIKDILELRHCLEVQAARSAALNAPDEKIEELQEIVDIMETIGDEDIKSELDVKFHNKLMGLNDNILFQIIADSISHLLSPFIKGIREIYGQDDEDLQRYYFINQHQKIIDAIKERNPAKAVRAVVEHINLTEEDMIKLDPELRSNKKDRDD